VTRVAQADEVRPEVGEGRGRRGPASMRRVAVQIVGVVLLVYLISPNSMVSDSVRVVPVAQQIISHGSIGLVPDRVAGAVQERIHGPG